MGALNLPEGFAREHLDGTMEGWYQNSSFGSSSIVAHWVTFLFLLICTMYLARESWSAKGPGGKELYFAGYHEEYNISLYVNLFALMAYYGKIVADTVGHNYNNVGPLVIGLGNYRYADYMLTCPILAWDLMTQVRAPFKVTGAIMIFCVLLSGTATNFYPGDEMRQGAIAWYAFGVVMYSGAYFLFYTIVRKQYSRLVALSATAEAKKAFMPLKLALYTFFSIWVVFPVVWLLGYHGFNVLTNDAQECLHCACDLVAKSMYGFALAKYRKYFDKKMWDMLESLGVDAEQGLDQLEKDLKECDDPRGVDIRRLSMAMGTKTKDTLAFSPEAFPQPSNGFPNVMVQPSAYPNHQTYPNPPPIFNQPANPSVGSTHNRSWRDASQENSPRDEIHHDGDGADSNVDNLRKQLDAINDQLRREYERKDASSSVRRI